MRYQVEGFTIRSENSAKPAKQASGYLVQLLKGFGPFDHAHVVEFAVDRSRFDFILCTNVLSAVPSVTKRRQIVRLLLQKLRQKGRCLFVCQYTNSDFFRQLADTKVKKHADGYIKGTKQNASFYGLMNLPTLRRYIEEAGMVIEKAWVNDQSAYVVGLSR